MATRNIYREIKASASGLDPEAVHESGFDEGVRTDSNANQCPECDGRVTTNTVETVCEDCGLVIDENRIDHGLEWRAYEDDERERTGTPLTAARHDRGLSTEIGHKNRCERQRTLRPEATSSGSNAPRAVSRAIPVESRAQPRTRVG